MGVSDFRPEGENEGFVRMGKWNLDASSFSLSLHLIVAQRVALFYGFICSHTRLSLVLDRYY